MSASRLYLLLSIVAFLGCGGEKSPAAKEGRARPTQDAVAKPMLGADWVALRDKGEAVPKAKAEAIPRKIIYTATINLVVESFDDAQEKLTDLIKQYPDAYVANSEVRGAHGERRYGTWTVRVPVGPFDDFLDAVARLGELQQRKLDSDDITDRFFDLKAELQTNQTEEQSLRKLLETSSGKLEDVIKVRQALTEIRSKINQQQGQLNRWEKLSELATAHITIQERKDYVPPLSPDFGTSISRTFKNSWDALIDFCKGFVLFVVAVVPWIPILVLTVLPFWLLFRRRSRREPTAEVTAIEPSPPTSG